jgi:RNA polymerase sigma factor for flagellar operon FliA
MMAMAPLVKRVAFEMRRHLPPDVEMDDLVAAGTLGLVDALRKFDPSGKVKLENYARHRIRGGVLDALRSLDPATALRTPPAGSESAQPAPREDPFDLCYRREQRDLVKRALASLTEREKLILTLYYAHDLTVKQIAARLNVDESRISGLHAEALQRLKARVRASLRPAKQVGGKVAGQPDFDESRESQLYAEALRQLKESVRASLPPAKQARSTPSSSGGHET